MENESRSEYPETRLDNDRTIVVIFQDEMDYKALHTLVNDDLNESDINYVHSFDNNVKVIFSVPDSENVEAIKEYWKAVIDELSHPCCNLCRSNKSGTKPGFDCDDCSDTTVPFVDSVMTLSEFIRQDRENNDGVGIYESEYLGIAEFGKAKSFLNPVR